MKVDPRFNNLFSLEQFQECGSSKISKPNVIADTFVIEIGIALGISSVVGGVFSARTVIASGGVACLASLVFSGPRLKRNIANVFHETKGREMNLDEFKQQATELSPWAHMATVGADGAPHVAPVHPAWDGDIMWIMTTRTAVKVRNIANQNRVALHWQVSEKGDGVEIWGKATVVDDVEVKRRLWNGVFDYDLSVFSPGGPDNSPDTVFISIEPTRALYLKSYGMAGIERWSAS